MTKKQSGCFLEHCVHFASSTTHAKCKHPAGPRESAKKLLFTPSIERVWTTPCNCLLYGVGNELPKKLHVFQISEYSRASRNGSQGLTGSTPVLRVSFSGCQYVNVSGSCTLATTVFKCRAATVEQFTTRVLERVPYRILG